jgi:hypothetical protein
MQSTKYPALLQRTSAWARCTYGEFYHTIEAHLQWEAFSWFKRTLTINGRTHSPGTKLLKTIIRWRKCTCGQDLFNSSDILWRLWWRLRTQLLWTIEVHLLTVTHSAWTLCSTHTRERQSIWALLIAVLHASSWHPNCFGDLDRYYNRHTSPRLDLVTGWWCRHKIVGKRKSRVGLSVLTILYSFCLEYDSPLFSSDILVPVYWILDANWQTWCPRCVWQLMISYLAFLGCNLEILKSTGLKASC